MNPTETSIVKQTELITTLVEQFRSLAVEFRSLRNSTDQNIRDLQEFMESRDRNRVKQIHKFTKSMQQKCADEAKQFQMNTHLETATNNIKDDETDGPDALKSSRASSYAAFMQTNREHGFRAEKVIRIVETLRNRDDILAVEDFISTVRKARARCKESDRGLLLDLILVEKIVGKAKRNVRYTKINSFDDLYSCLRQRISASPVVNNCRAKLKSVKQGATESVQSFNCRFQQQLNELNYAIQNVNNSSTEQRIDLRNEEHEVIRTYLLNLRFEIGQMVIASDPKNLTIAQQVAIDRELWLQQTNNIANAKIGKENTALFQ